MRLDIAQQTATAYLNVLRAKTFERVQKDNLQLTRSNLELARVRRQIGVSGPAEVYRWESQMAIVRQYVPRNIFGVMCPAQLCALGGELLRWPALMWAHNIQRF